MSIFIKGHYGDAKLLGDGIKELRFHFGPGYRIYFGEDDHNIILLLLGGDKASQVEDIRKSRAFWKDYLERKGNERL